MQMLHDLATVERNLFNGVTVTFTESESTGARRKTITFDDPQSAEWFIFRKNTALVRAVMTGWFAQTKYLAYVGFLSNPVWVKDMRDLLRKVGPVITKLESVRTWQEGADAVESIQFLFRVFGEKLFKGVTARITYSRITLLLDDYLHYLKETHGVIPSDHQ